MFNVKSVYNFLVSAFRPLGNEESVGLKHWSTRSATTPHIDLAKKREKNAFRNLIHDLYAAI